MSDTTMIPMIVCVGEHGRAVVYGYAEAYPETGGSVVLHRARMVLRWDAACGGLLGLAANGPRGDTRITHAVERTGARPVQQYTSVSPEAARALDEWRAYGG